MTLNLAAPCASLWPEGGCEDGTPQQFMAPVEFSQESVIKDALQGSAPMKNAYYFVNNGYDFPILCDLSSLNNKITRRTSQYRGRLKCQRDNGWSAA